MGKWSHGGVICVDVMTCRSGIGVGAAQKARSTSEEPKRL